MSRTKKREPEYIRFYCDTCGDMPSLEYGGMNGSLPTLFTSCRCGKGEVKIFNRCDRFPVQPALNA